ncbi:LuxR C-terminal-related transcriptional regulator [Actinoplanes sp. NPDC049599]|uniref:LuxR C-terminal-related transcriptional regulator n=1 Tax=Actinoplanes sp. NPDC049599 TaxID=3363903 RepID=UPI0037A36310
MAYAILRTSPDLNLDGFATRLGMAVPEAAALLDQLVDLSLVRRNEESGRFYVPTTPLMAMQQIIQRERAALDARRRSLNESYDMLADFMADLPEDLDAPTAAPAPDRSPSGAYATAERIEGVTAVRERLQELADQSRQEVLSFAPPARDSGAARRASRRPDQEVLARGVITRTLYLDTIVSEPQALAYARELIAAGGQVRLVPTLPIRLIIVDHVVAAIPIDPSDGSVGALILHDASTVSAMEALFEAYWRDGRPVPGTATADEASATDIAILRLLATGAKDEAVARQLGVSVRTVRRAIATMMGRLNAESRFELAVRAAARGLLD